MVVLEGVKKGVVRKLYIFAAEAGDCGSPPVDTIIISNANYFMNFYIENIIKIYPHYSSLSSSFFKACREASKNKKTVQKGLLSENFTKWRFSREGQKVN